MASPTSSAELPGPPRTSWIILSRVAQHVAGEPSSLPLTKRPRLSSLTIPSRFKGDHAYYGDAGDPYIIAANDAGILLHVSPTPRGGFNLDHNPVGSSLVVVWDLWPEDGTGRNEVILTSTVRIPDRAAELSAFSGVKSVGFLPLSAPAGFVVAELQVVEDHARRAANLVWYCYHRRSDEGSWNEAELPCPDVAPGANAEWIPHDVIAHDGKLWWVDLTRGLLVCNPLDPNPHLSFVELPDLAGEMFVALEDRHEALERIDSCRVVRVSGGELRFVDLVRRRNEDPGTTRVVVWTLESMFDPSMGRARWEHHQCTTTLAEIWDHVSYVQSGMPRELPALAFLHPHKDAVVYFFLGEYLFSVNVYDSAVVQYGTEADVVEVPGGPPINWRYVLAWLPPLTMSISGWTSWFTSSISSVGEALHTALRLWLTRRPARHGLVLSKQMFVAVVLITVLCLPRFAAGDRRFNEQELAAVMDEIQRIQQEVLGVLEIPGLVEQPWEFVPFIRPIDFEDVLWTWMWQLIRPWSWPILLALLGIAYLIGLGPGPVYLAVVEGAIAYPIVYLMLTILAAIFVIGLRVFYLG